MPESGNGDSQITAVKCNFKGFLKRTAYNLSGRRSIGYILGVLGVITVLVVTRIWTQLNPDLAKQALTTVERFGLAYLTVQGIPTAIDAFKGKPRGDQ